MVWTRVGRRPSRARRGGSRGGAGGRGGAPPAPGGGRGLCPPTSSWVDRGGYSWGTAGWGPGGGGAGSDDPLEGGADRTRYSRPGQRPNRRSCRGWTGGN